MVVRCLKNVRFCEPFWLGVSWSLALDVAIYCRIASKQAGQPEPNCTIPRLRPAARTRRECVDIATGKKRRQRAVQRMANSKLVSSAGKPRTHHQAQFESKGVNS